MPAPLAATNSEGSEFKGQMMDPQIWAAPYRMLQFFFLRDIPPEAGLINGWPGGHVGQIDPRRISIK